MHFDGPNNYMITKRLVLLNTCETNYKTVTPGQFARFSSRILNSRVSPYLTLSLKKRREMVLFLAILQMMLLIVPLEGKNLYRMLIPAYQDREWFYNS